MPDEIIAPPVQVDVDRDKIKRAVKEALDDKKLEDLSQQMTGLSKQVAEGFAASHQRHDLANGKLLKSETRLNTLEKQIQEIAKRDTFWSRNQDKLVWGVVGVVLMLFYYLLTNNGFPRFLN